MLAYGLGVGTQNANKEWLEIYYPCPAWNPDPQEQEVISSVAATSAHDSVELSSAQLETLASALQGAGNQTQANIAKELSNSRRPVVLCVLEQDSAPADTPQAYLKLHLISHRLVKPHDLDLTGIFALLPNVAWTSAGAIDLQELPARQLAARAADQNLQVFSIDKFPKMTDYVVPSGVRIAHTARVRLGAYVGEGTTIMHEGFINFNAGSEGKSMIEGRISAGVVVGEGSDLGGGCSTMGTLSGGGGIVISIGKNSLVGANAGVGIPLGDRCKIEAGLYITAGTKVVVIDDDGKPIKQLKARDLAGRHDLLFRRNSMTGQVEAVTNRAAIKLNDALHANN